MSENIDLQDAIDNLQSALAALSAPGNQSTLFDQVMSFAGKCSYAQTSIKLALRCLGTEPQP